MKTLFLTLVFAAIASAQVVQTLPIVETPQYNTLVELTPAEQAQGAALQLAASQAAANLLAWQKQIAVAKLASPCVLCQIIGISFTVDYRNLLMTVVTTGPVKHVIPALVP